MCVCQIAVFFSLQDTFNKINENIATSKQWTGEKKESSCSKNGPTWITTSTCYNGTIISNSMLSEYRCRRRQGDSALVHGTVLLCHEDAEHQPWQSASIHPINHANILWDYIVGKQGGPASLLGLWINPTWYKRTIAKTESLTCQQFNLGLIQQCWFGFLGINGALCQLKIHRSTSVIIVLELIWYPIRVPPSTQTPVSHTHTTKMGECVISLKTECEHDIFY